MSNSCLSPHPHGVLLSVSVVPKSSRSEIVDIVDDRCKIKVKAAPLEGKANEALIAYLVKLFDLPKSSVSLEGGLRSRHKTVLLRGMTMQAAWNALQSAISGVHRKGEI